MPLPVPSDRFVNNICKALFIGIVLAAAWTYGARLGDSLWLDELHTSWCAAGSIGEVSSRAQQGNNSPLFFYAVWIVGRLFGPSEYACRILSWSAGMGTLVLVYVAAKNWTRSRLAGLTAAALMAIDGNLIYFASEARPYACVQLFATVSMVAFYHYLQSGSLASRAIYVSASIVIFYLHYTAGLLWFGAAVYGIIYLIAFQTHDDPKLPTLRKLMIDGLIVSGSTVFAVPHLRFVAARKSNWEKFIADDRSVFAMLDISPAMNLIGVGILVAIALSIGCRLLYGRREARNDPRSSWNWFRQPAIFSICWLMVPMLVALVLNNTDVARLFFRRYLVATLPAPYLLIAMTVALPIQRNARCLVASIVVLVGLSPSPVVDLDEFRFHVSRHSKENWRDAISVIRSEPKPRLMIVRPGLIEDADIDSDETGELHLFCKFPVHGLYDTGRESDDIVVLSSRLDAVDQRVVESLRRERSAWLLVRGRTQTREKVLLGFRNVFDAASLRIESIEIEASPNLGLYLVEIRE